MNASIKWRQDIDLDGNPVNSRRGEEWAGTAKGEIHPQEEVCAHCGTAGHNPPKCREWLTHNPDVHLKPHRPASKSPSPAKKELPTNLRPRRSTSNSSRGASKPPKVPAAKVASSDSDASSAVKRRFEPADGGELPQAKRVLDTENFEMGDDDIDLDAPNGGGQATTGVDEFYYGTWFRRNTQTVQQAVGGTSQGPRTTVGNAS